MRKHIFILSWMVMSASIASSQSKYIQAVDEYVPAPGQFVNTMPEATIDDTPATMAQKCTAAIANGNGELITLGAWGGYVTFHFDHPVVNVEGVRDFAIWGNAFQNNAEPGIVLVSVDGNGNGLPDDEWYELKGSEYDNAATIHDYSLTYTFDALKDVAWTDNQNGTGKVPRNNFHRQEYFPLWLSSQRTLTFEGARLPNNSIENNGSFILPTYDYGYADNYPNSNKEGCSLDIAWAVDEQGQRVQLDHVDFIRCYSAMNQVCGTIGETSTEISGGEDLHPEATGISPVTSSSDTQPSSYYSLDGRKLSGPQQGVNIVRMKNGTVRKVKM